MMCLQTVHYATTGEITCRTCKGNFINPGRDRVRSRTLPQPRLVRFSIVPKHVVIGK